MSEGGQMSSSQLAELSRRLERVEKWLAGLTQRIYALEQRQEPHAAPGAPVRPEAAKPPTPRPPVPAVPPISPAQMRPRAAAPRRGRSFSEGIESELALKWMGRIGVVALLVGAGFFLQHAFASLWIGPIGQVSIGIVAGLALLALGEHNRRLGRRAFGEALIGGGTAILYTSIYAAYAFYRPQLMNQPTAFGLMILVTAMAVVVAVRTDALSTAIIATIGGFLTPVLVRQSGSSQSVPGMVMLFGYIAVLDGGLLVLSFFRQWRVLQILSFSGTWFIIWGWLATSYTTSLAWPAYATMVWFFLVFAFVPVVRNLWQRVQTRQVDLWLIILNAAFFFPTVALLPTDTPLNEYLGLYAVITAIFYLCLGSLALQRSPDDKLLVLSWLGLGLAFVIVAVPLQLGGTGLCWAGPPRAPF